MGISKLRKLILICHCKYPYIKMQNYCNKGNGINKAKRYFRCPECTQIIEVDEYDNEKRGE